MVGTPSVENIADILNDLVDSSQSPVMVSEDEESGAITVTLGDGTQFSVETVGFLSGKSCHNFTASCILLRSNVSC